MHTETYTPRFLLCLKAFYVAVFVAAAFGISERAEAQSCGGHSYVYISPCNPHQMPISVNTSFTINYYMYQGTWGYSGLVELEPYIYNGAGVTSCELKDQYGDPVQYVYLDYSTSYPIQFTMTCYTSSTPDGATVDLYAWDENHWYTLNTLNRIYVGTVYGFNRDIGIPSSNLNTRAPCADACFSKVFTHSTVPYYTLDTPRSISVIYDSDRHRPMPVVMEDVEIQDMGGYWQYMQSLTMRVDLDGGGTLATVTKTGNVGIEDGPVRISAQLDMTGYSTGVYPIVVTTTMQAQIYTWDDQLVTRNFTRVDSTNLVVVNDADSPIGPGWTFAGIQRLYFPSVGGFLIVENGGPVEYFKVLGSGNSSNFTTLDTLPDGRYVRTYRDGSKVTFLSTGLMDHSIDRSGLMMGYGFDGSGRLDTVVEPMRYLGQDVPYYVIQYNSSGFEVKERTNSQWLRTTTYAKNSSGITRITDPDGNYTDFDYYGSGNYRLKSVTDRNGAVFTTKYDSRGRVVADSMPAVPINIGSGSTITGSPMTTYRPGTTLPLANSSMLLRDTAYTNVVNSLGFTSKYITDVWGQPLSILDEIGNTTTIDRDVFQPTSINRPGIGTEDFTYSGDFLTGVKSPSGAWTYYRYGAFAQVDSIWGDGVVPQRFVINATTGNIDTVRTGKVGGGTYATTMTYDSYGRVLTTTDNGSHVTQVSYNTLTGNADSTLSAGNRWTKVRFDIYGRDSMVTAAGQSTGVRTSYDILNRPTVVKDIATGDSTRITYDKLYRRSVRNAKGELADSAEYNALGWVTKQYDTNDPTKYISYRYNDLGWLTSYTNRRNQMVNIQYDTLGRFLGKWGDNVPGSSMWYDNGEEWALSIGYSDYNSVAMYTHPKTTVDSVLTTFGSRNYKIAHTAPDSFYKNITVNISSSSGPSFTNRTFARLAIHS